MSHKFMLYGHGGSYNHGAEAIVKCTVPLIKSIHPDSKILLSTHFKDQDLRFDLPVDAYCERDSYYVKLDKSTSTKGIYDHLIYKSTLDNIDTDTICLSIGGDNYCYPNWHRFSTIHKIALQRGARSVLWGCSIEPTIIDQEMLEVLKNHHIIVARESCTYDALRECGLVNVVLCPDSAFLLESKEISLPVNFVTGNTIGLNISPLVQRREYSSGIFLQNVFNLIQYIMDQTDMAVALIPHVVMPVDNDFELLSRIYKDFEKTGRMSLLSDGLSAAEYKYAISKCRLMIAARTHASIAAYSSCVPTLAIGYSIKAKGLGRDLGFSNYVLDLNTITEKDSLLNVFYNFQAEEEKLKRCLEQKIPNYRKGIWETLSTVL